MTSLHVILGLPPLQGWQYSTVRWYGTVRLNFCEEVRYAATVRFFCDGTGTVCWYSV